MSRLSLPTTLTLLSPQEKVINNTVNDYRHSYNESITSYENINDKNLKNASSISYQMNRNDRIRRELSIRKNEYMRNHKIKIFCGTWNLNAKKPITIQESAKLVSWLEENKTYIDKNNKEKTYDIIAVGFQEIVDLNAVNVVVTNLSQQRTNQWEETLLYTLNSYLGKEKYSIIYQKHLVGILLFIFVKQNQVKYVTDVQATSAGVGVMGVMGNKGGVAIRMKYYQSTFCFVCAHMAAHRENVHGRNADFHNIISKIEFHENTSNLMDQRVSSQEISYNVNYKTPDDIFGILDHDFVFWLGDLNYRVTDDLSSDKIFSLVERNKIEILLSHEQLNIERANGNVFEGFDEGKINFLPSYKFQVGTCIYDRRPDKKIRAPAWCDRILWKSKNPDNTKLVEYDMTTHLDLSDHKPIKATFLVNMEIEFENKRKEVLKDILHQADKLENESMPKIRIDGEKIIHFADLRYLVPLTHTIEIHNIGNVVADFRFIPKSKETLYCQKWLIIHPIHGMILPKENIKIKITAKIDNLMARELFRFIYITNSNLNLNVSNTSNDEKFKKILEDVLILHIENRGDFFFPVTATYSPSCFGASLDYLLELKSPIRLSGKNESFDCTKVNKSDKILKIPRELWRMIDDMYSNFMEVKGLFSESGNHLEMPLLRESLDTGEPFPIHSPHSMAELLLTWLQSLQNPVIPDNILNKISLCDFVSIDGIQETAKIFLHNLPIIHCNTLSYIISFGRELLKHASLNRLTPSKIAMAFSCRLIQTDSDTMEENPIFLKKCEYVNKLLLYFLTKSNLK